MSPSQPSLSGIQPQVGASRSKPVLLAQAGIIGALAAFVPGEVLHAALTNESRQGSFVQLVVVTSLWMLIYAVAYSIAMVIGQNIYLRRPCIDQKEAMVSAAGGALAGLISGGLAQAFFGIAVRLTIISGVESLVLIECARVVAWAMFGAMIGLGMSLFIPNLGRIYGVIGGVVGGAVGAVGFILATAFAGDLVGRLIGMAIVGGALGFAIGLVEAASRSAWLQVAFGTVGESRIVSLGKEFVCLGSDSRRCAVWTPGAAPVALRFRFVDGQVTCDDVVAQRQMVVPPGFQQQIGAVNVTVCVAKTSVAVSPPSPTYLAPPAPPPPGRLPVSAITAGPPQVQSVRQSALTHPSPSEGTRRVSGPTPPPPPPTPR